MEQYRILIPSFKRSEQQRTLQLLSGVYERERIILSTQTKEDYDAYNRLYGGVATVIYREANSVGGNRNTLLEYCEKNNISNGLFLDDDLRGIVFYSGRKTNDAKEIKSVFDYFFEVANSSEKRAQFYGMSMAEYMRWLWNNPQAGQSPYKMFEGAMKPSGKDANGNLIYEYAGAKF